MSDHDGLKLRIAVGKGHRGQGKSETVTWAELRKRLTTFMRTREALRDYLALSIDDQGKLKAKPGWWISADLPDGSRKRGHIGLRPAIVFDIDTISPGRLQLLLAGKNPVCRYEFAAHSTRKHEPAKPRARVVFPLAKPIPNDHYEAATRILAHMLDPSMETVDPVSFRKIQMMYLPSASVDSKVLNHHNSGELLDVQELFDDFAGDWQNYADLPRAPSEKKARETAAKAQNPLDKGGIVGAFCRTYDVHQAIEKFIPDVYNERDDSGEKVRYTYAYGSGSNGIEVQDDGLFIYSHHGSDPCGDELNNAFDMVRKHLFGDHDKAINEEDKRKPTKWPSFIAMAEMLEGDAEVMRAPPPERDADFDDEDVEAADPVIADLIGGPSEPAPRPKPKPAPAPKAVVSEIDTLDADLDELVGRSKAAPKTRDAIADILGGEPDEADRKLGPVDELNAKYAVVNSGGTVVILHETDDGDVEFMRQTDFKLAFGNRTVPKAGQDIPLADYWISHPRRRQFLGGVGFWPMRDAPKGYFNLWKGFAVEPNPDGSCDLLLEHVRTAVCGGNEENYRYLMGWLAHMIQRPYEKPGVAVALKGLKGVGKDTVGDYIGKLFPTNHVKIAQMDQLTGKFNSHFERALLLHAEEAIWAGDKAAHGPLQNAITAPYMRIERKNIDSTQKPNYLRLFISSNEDWIVPARGNDERRYFVLEVLPIYRRNHAHFAAIWAQGEAGGYGAFLHLLQTWDLTGFNVRNPPETTGNADQKVVGLKGEQAFWHEILDEAELPEETKGNWLAEEVTLPVETFHGAYMQWMKDRPRGGHGQPVSAIELSRRMRLMVKHTILQRGGKSRRASYHVLPSLAVCRQRFCEFLGTPVSWHEDEIEVEEVPGQADDDFDDDDVALV